jgi:ribose transport system ATP-binding protein
MLGLEKGIWGFVRRRAHRHLVRDTLSRLGHGELQPTTMVSQLSMGARQVVEIARALVHNAKVLAFDEPTSSLAQRDTEQLFRIIARLKQDGHGIIYISHFLEEVRQVADTFTVLRDGENAGGGSLADVSDSEIVSKMVGRTVSQLFPSVPHTPGAPVLALNQVSGRASPRSVSLELRRGEILGLAGLVGAGRTETLRCLFGLDRLQAGTITLQRQNVPQKLGVNFLPRPQRSIAAGLGFLSEDRKGEGLAQQLSIVDNVTLSRLSPFSRGGWLVLGKRRRTVVDWIHRLAIKVAFAEQPVAALSGGNQQKVAIARILHQNADILLLDEPTRGIDVGTKSEIYRLMGELAAQGKSIVFVSSYLPELLAVCDRIGVMARGRLRALRDAADWTEESIMACAIASDS